MKLNTFVAEAKKGNIDLVEHTHKVVEESQKISKEYRYVAAWADTIARAEELQKQATSGNAKKSFSDAGPEANAAKTAEHL